MALAADRPDTTQKNHGTHAEVLEPGVAASTLIYAGALVAINASGYAVPASAAQGLVVVGRAEARADNSSGTAGAINVRIRRGVFKFKNSSGNSAVSAADVLRPCYAADDETVSRDSSRGTRPFAGRVIAVETDGVHVECGVLDNGREIDLVIPAAGDLSSAQYLAVYVDSAGKIALQTTAGGKALGILQNAPAADGAMAIVRVFGVSRATAGGVITPGGDVAVITTSGKLKAAVASTVNTSDGGAASDPVIGSYVLGIGLNTANTADDDLFSVFINHMGAVPSTAA